MNENEFEHLRIGEDRRKYTRRAKDRARELREWCQTIAFFVTIGLLAGEVLWGFWLIGGHAASRLFE